MVATGHRAPSLARKAFSVSRLAEFASVPELIKQTGHAVEAWPLVAVKELLDNSLDECEEAGIAPEVRIEIGENSITVTDNGRGIPSETVEKLPDYSRRTSSRAVYASPSRGAQGNALQSILAMPFALDGARGETLIESCGTAHRLVFSVDLICQEPRVAIEQSPSLIKSGTLITVKWPDQASSFFAIDPDDFLQLVTAYAWTNPHLAVTASLLGRKPVVYEPTDRAWTKWRPNMPTSPYWYDLGSLARLIAAEIAYAEDEGEACPTVREFVTQFRGLSGTQKAKHICRTLGADRQTLKEFYADGKARIDALLALMRDLSRPIKPRDLGIIGKAHLEERLAAAGADLDSFDYRMNAFESLGLPYVIEVGFAYSPHIEKLQRAGEDAGRVLLSGLNFSPALGANPFRDLGGGVSLDGILADQWADDDEPVIAFVHLTTPRIKYLDKGKTQVAR